MNTQHTPHEREHCAPRNRIKALLFNYISSGQGCASDARLRYVNAVTLLGTPSIIASSLLEYSVGKLWLSTAMALFAGLAIANAVWLRHSLNAARAATHILLLMLVLFTVTMADGMYQATAPYWLATFPAVAFFFKGPREGGFWVSGFLGLIAMALLLQATGITTLPFGIAELLLMLMSTTTIAAMVYTYEQLRAQADRSLRRARQELYQLAHHDPLTGLPNRHLLYERLTEALEQADGADHRLAVLFLDLDGFKPINDEHGHEVGDEVLSLVANRLSTHLRPNDTLARVGGDEFVVVIPRLTTPDEANHIAHKLLDVFTQPFVTEGARCQLGASIGVGIYPDCADSQDGLLRLADRAMYLAKHSGKNRVSSCPYAGAGSAAMLKGEKACLQRCMGQLRTAS